MTAHIDATLMLDDDPLTVRAIPLANTRGRPLAMVHVGPLTLFGATDQIRAALTEALAALDGMPAPEPEQGQ